MTKYLRCDVLTKTIRGKDINNPERFAKVRRELWDFARFRRDWKQWRWDYYRGFKDNSKVTIILIGEY